MYNPPIRVTQAANFAGADITMQDVFTYSYKCDITSSTAAVCTESAAGSEANFPGVETATLTGTDMAYLPVTITAGLEKLSGTNNGGGGADTTTTSAGSPGATAGTKTSQTTAPDQTETPSSSTRIRNTSGTLAFLAGLVGFLV